MTSIIDAEPLSSKASCPDVNRHPVPKGPAVPGAQWDEVEGAWVRWDETAHAWFVVDRARGVAHRQDPPPLPPALARELVHVHDLEVLDLLHEPDVVLDLRAPEPAVHVPGAQWNELLSRWERWDAVTGQWVSIAAPSR